MPETETSNWYLFRITNRNEKKVRDILDISGIENFIPFSVTEYNWKGVFRNVETPLYPGIGFARVDSFDLGMLKMMEEISLFVQT